MSSAVLEIRQGQVGIFGYGSLLWRESMELTLGRPYIGPSPVCTLAGWRRSWDVTMPNTTFYEATPAGDLVPETTVYLNLRQSPGESVNGVLYVITGDDLEAFDRREWIYDRMAVTPSMRDITIRGAEVYTYVGKKEHLIRPNSTRSEAGLRRSYLDIVSRGLANLGQSFSETYYASTDHVPTELIFSDQKRPGTHPHLAEARPR